MAPLTRQWAGSAGVPDKAVVDNDGGGLGSVAGGLSCLAGGRGFVKLHNKGEGRREYGFNEPTSGCHQVSCRMRCNWKRAKQNGGGGGSKGKNGG